MANRKSRIDPGLREILDRFQIDPEDPDMIWEVHGKLVLYHYGYEKIAAALGVKWTRVDVLEAKVSGDDYSVSVLVMAELGPRVEWSIGEASNLNYHGSPRMSLYPYAMAEKRGKDRVIGKLANLSSYGVYSEEEADDFKQGRGQRTEEFIPTEQPPNEPLTETFVPDTRQADPFEFAGDPKVPQNPEEWKEWEAMMRATIAKCSHMGDLKILWKRQDQALEKLRVNFSGQYRVVLDWFTNQREKLNAR